MNSIYSEDTSYLLSLPDEILINEIFPKLPNRYLNSICQANIRFRRICNSDLLYKRKLELEYPNLLGFKSEDIRNCNFYQFLYKSPIVSIYLNGHLVSRIVFPFYNIKFIESQTNINLLEYYLLFLDKELSEVAFSSFNNIVINDNYQIKYIVLIPKTSEYGMSIGRYIKAFNEYPKFIFTDNLVYINNTQQISLPNVTEILFSNLGHPTIYALKRYGNISVYTSFSLNEDIRYRGLIDYLSKDDLINILYHLKVPAPNVHLPSVGDISSYLVKNYKYDIKILSIQELQYLYSWISGEIDRHQMINIIIENLKLVNHYFE
jgi:hypothetical protein